VESGELSVDEGAVGEALLADVLAPHPTLATLADAFAARRTLIVPDAIEGPDTPWLPRSLESFVLETRPVEHFNRQLTMFLDQVKTWVADGETVALVASGDTRLAEMLRAANLTVERSATMLHLRESGAASFVGHAPGMTKGGVVFVDRGNIEAGFAIPGLRLHVLGDREIYGQPPKRVKLRAVKEGVPVTLADLKVGDYVVHAVHGIGQYLGLRAETILGATQDYLELKYAGTDRMLVPVHADASGDEVRRERRRGAAALQDGRRRLGAHEGRVSETSRRSPRASSDSTRSARARPATRSRPTRRGKPNSKKRSPTIPTPDQAEGDRRREGRHGAPAPDGPARVRRRRLRQDRSRRARHLQGDRRQAQVAILVPTTLLAAQHYRTFTARFASFPVRIEELSRFKTKKEQQATLKDLADGKVDVVVGTHRLLQKDVVFANLGLIVVDEEQRFGVMHKERLKQMRATVDVLTLSATPIPRTLHMSLLGVRDLSLIQTPPKNRMSIKTVVVPFSDAIVQRAIVQELDRGGQVYYVHNRIESIYGVARALEQLVPKARIGVGHGQMTEGELEPMMAQFIEGEIDVLVSTTIIENGIDIPNVNTIIVNDADKLRPRAALSVARPRRTLEPSGVRVPALPGAQGAQRRCESASRSDPRVHAPRQRAADRDARSRDSRRRQPARRGAVRLHRRRRASRRTRAARRGDRRAQGRASAASRETRSRDRREARRVHPERLHPAGLAEDRRLPAARDRAHAKRRSTRSRPACATASARCPSRSRTSSRSRSCARRRSRRT
jgi:superfamily II DNA/RNA helicase